METWLLLCYLDVHIFVGDYAELRYIPRCNSSSLDVRMSEATFRRILYNLGSSWAEKVSNHC